MTPLALWQLLGRAGLLLFGVLGICATIWAALVYNRLPQDAPLRRLLPWSLRSRRSILLLGVPLCVSVIVFAFAVPGAQVSGAGPGLLAVCSTVFWLACALAGVRFMSRQRQLADRLRRDGPDQTGY